LNEINNNDTDNASQAFINIESSGTSTDATDHVVKFAAGKTNEGKNRDPKETTATQAWRSNRVDALSFVPDYENDTYFVVLDPDQACFTRPAGTLDAEDPSAGDTFATNFSVHSYNTDDSNYGLVNENEDGLRG